MPNCIDHILVYSIVKVVAMTANITNTRNPNRNKNVITPTILNKIDLADNNDLSVTIIKVVAMDDKILNIKDLTIDMY